MSFLLSLSVGVTNCTSLFRGLLRTGVHLYPSESDVPLTERDSRRYLPLSQVSITYSSPRSALPTSLPGQHYIPLSQVSVTYLSPRSALPTSLPGQHYIPLSQVSVTYLSPRSAVRTSLPGQQYVPLSQVSITYLSPRSALHTSLAVRPGAPLRTEALVLVDAVHTGGATGARTRRALVHSCNAQAHN